MQPQNIIKAMLIGLIAVSLGACGETNDDKCDGPVSVGGEADMTASPSLAATGTAGGADVDVTVSVDGDTVAGGVGFLPEGAADASGVTFAAFVPLAGSAVVAVPAPAATGTYYPVVVLCTTGDINTTCGTAIGYVDDPSGIVSASNYVRGTYDTVQGTTTSIANSCVGMPTITFN